ncbi:MAG: response regulator [Ignavibacteria bacterium]|nr:response regulator [Ignavibacteria bacterium]
MSKGKILIVEDQIVVATNLKILLRHNNYEVIGVATNSEDALKMIEKEVPDLVVMDVVLDGDIDGIETTKILKKRWNIPVIFLTSHKEADIYEKAKQANAVGFFTKNFSINDQLPIILDFYIHRHQIESEKEKRLEQIAEQEELFHGITNFAKDAIVLIDHNAKISFWNKAAEKIFGYSAEEAINKELHEIIAPVTYKEFYKKVFSEFSNYAIERILENNLELAAANKEGDVFFIEIALSKLLIKEKLCYCAYIRDISTRKVAEEQMERVIEELQIAREVSEQNAHELVLLTNKLSESEEELRKLNTSKDKLFSIISHDLKNPLQGLRGYIDILSNSIGFLEKDDLKEIVDSLNQSSGLIYKLVENLLHWSRIQRGKIEYIPESLSLFQIVDLVLQLNQSVAKQKNISLINNVPCNFIARADPNMINTVIRNLVSNAIKFTNIDGTIIVDAKIEGKQIISSVKDNGVGISKENLDKIFKLDCQVTTYGTANEKGTGLGLVLCDELIQKNFGKLWVESEVGVGTTFYFSLPIAEEENN